MLQFNKRAAGVNEVILTTGDHRTYIQPVCLITDAHYDSTHCARELLEKHLRQANEHKAIVHLNGDVFDAMGGKFDKRSSKDSLRPEYQKGNYFDLIVEDAAAFFSQFKDCAFHISYGNHETSIRKIHETDLIQRLAERMKTNGITVETGMYSGWLLITRQYPTKNRMVKLWYHHGYGGAAPRSKGIMHADIDQMQTPDADIIVKGHDHNSWYLPVTVDRLNYNYEIVQHTVHHIRAGSYKSNERAMGWEAEKGFNQVAVGGWMVNIEFVNTNIPEIKVFKM